MIRIRKVSIYIIVVCILFINFNLFSINDEANKLLSDGIEFFRTGLYKQAIINFRDILINPNFMEYHGDAYFWISKSYMVLEKLNEAEKNLEYYLINFKDHPHYSEALYQKGRLLFMQNEFENAIQILTNFVDKYPNSVFQSNAYFWIGESLYLLGKLDEALKVFKNIVQNYPESFKYEAAKYRMSIIEFKKRENELLKLLKWSHMESLKSLEEFQKKERTYEQALTSYQKKIALLDSSNQNTVLAQITDKELEIEKLKNEILELKKNIQTLEDKLKNQSTTVPVVDNNSKTTSVTTDSTAKDNKLLERLLKAKSDALDLKELLLNILAGNMEINKMYRRIYRFFIIITLFFYNYLWLFALEVTDGKMKLILHEDIGRFSVYYMIDMENKKYIPLFTDQDPRTTTFSIIVNNKAYRLGDSISFKETSEKTTNGAKFTWKSNQLEITQEFSFIKSVTSTESDGIKISTIFTNISETELEIGARFIIDTNLGESSSAHFKTNTGLKISKETKIEANEMVDYWLSPKDDNSGLMVVTKSTGITTPDIVIFANWKRLNDTSWSYTTSSSRNFNLPPYSINDSAVCHYYFPQKIGSGLSSEFVIVMGNYSDSGFIIKKTSTTTTNTSNTSTITTTNKTNTTTNPKDTTTVNNSTDNNSIMTISVKGDISTLETVIEEINSKIANNSFTEADIVLLEKIISELKTKANNYFQNK